MKPFHHEFSPGFLTEEFSKHVIFILQKSEKVKQLDRIEITAGIQPQS